MLRTFIAVVGTVILAAVSAGCAQEDETQSTAEVLAELEGRELTPAEVAQKEQVTELLCRLDDAVLREIWDQLDAEQLTFQDFVFSRQCPERNALYARSTGRFVAEE